jgi:hypothetical protein
MSTKNESKKQMKLTLLYYGKEKGKERRRRKKKYIEAQSLVVYTCGTIRKGTTGHLQHLYRR